MNSNQGTWTTDRVRHLRDFHARYPESGPGDSPQTGAEAMSTTTTGTVYVATTSHGGSRWVVAIGVTETRDELRERATRQICGDQYDTAKDIYTDTELKQLQITTLAQLERTSAGRAMADAYYEAREDY